MPAHDPVAAARAWDRAYERHHHERLWDCPWPSPELVSLVASAEPGTIRTAVDLGCGAGTEALFLARYGIRTVGADISRAGLRIAGQRASDSPATPIWCQADVLALPVRDSSMDLVNDRGTFHHLQSELRPMYAAEVARGLALGGRLFLRGMSEDGRKKTAVTPEVIGSFFGAEFFAQVGVTPYCMVGANGHAPGTLAVLTRRS